VQLAKNVILVTLNLFQGISGSVPILAQMFANCTANGYFLADGFCGQWAAITTAAIKANKIPAIKYCNYSHLLHLF
jgi:hypothetical protein